MTVDKTEESTNPDIVLVEHRYKMAEYQQELKKILGEGMYGKLQRAVNEGKLNEKDAQTFAFFLNPSVGGSFMNARDKSNFHYNGQEFMWILGEYLGKSDKVKHKSLPDDVIEILRHDDLGLNALASELEEKPPGVETRRANEREEEMQKRRRRWESACKEGKKEDVSELLKEDESLPKHEKLLNSNVTEGTANLTPLAVAALNGHSEIVKLLLSKGASMTRVSSWTPLEMAITGRHKDTADLLRKQGSNPETDLPRDLDYYRRNAGYRKQEGLLVNYGDEFEQYFDGLKKPSKVEEAGPE